MLVTERRARILEQLVGARAVGTEELARELGVSGETIRRDLAALEQQGRLSRVHGGAAAPLLQAAGEEASFAERASSGADAKSRIGRAAAALVRPNQLIVIDVGTTALQVARALPRDLTGTVATCSLLAATELADRPRLEVLVCGGRLRGGDLALAGAQAQAFFADLNPDIAFLGSGGVDARSGLTDYYLDEVAVRKTIIRNATASYVLADAAKLGRVAKHKVSDLRELAGLVTNGDPPDALAAAFADHGGHVVKG